MPPPVSVVVVNDRGVMLTTAQDGACGYSVTVENRDQTLPAGALQEPFIRLELAIALPVRTGQTAMPSWNSVPSTRIDLPVGTLAEAAHKANSPLQIIRSAADTVTGNSASRSSFFMFVLDFDDHVEQQENQRTGYAEQDMFYPFQSGV